jgi:alpha-mannosidase
MEGFFSSVRALTRWAPVLVVSCVLNSNCFAEARTSPPLEITKVDALPVLLLGEKTGREQPVVVELNVLAGRSSRNLKISGQVSAVHFEQEITVPKEGGHRTALLRVPYVATDHELEFSIAEGQKIFAQQKMTLSPVADFVFYLFPSSHLCVAYENSMLVDHDDLAYVVGQAIQNLERYPEATFTIEFAWGLKLYWDKFPEKRELVKRLVREGRLEIGGRFAPNLQEGQDEESLARQIAETQWWLRETFGRQASVAVDWDLPVLFPQSAQLYREGGLRGWVTGAYLGFDENKEQPPIATRDGSPFYKYVSPDGTSVPVMAPVKSLHEHYLNSEIVGEFGANRNGGGLLQTVPQALTAENLQQLSDLVRRAQSKTGMNFLAGTAGMSDQATPKEKLYQQAKIWNALFLSPRVEFISAGDAFAKAELTGKVVDRLEGEIPFWLRNFSNTLGLRPHINQAATSLRTAETLAALDSLTLGSLYPRESINAAWLELLRTQQHEEFETRVSPAGDVLDWSHANLDRVDAVAHSVTNLAMRDLASRIKYASLGQPVVVFNHLNWDVRETVFVKLPWKKNFKLLNGAGDVVPALISDSGDGSTISFVADVPPIGYATYYLATTNSGIASSGPGDAGNTIENEFYKITVNEKTGLITSLYDKRLARDLVDPAKPAGGFRIVWDDGGSPATWSLSRPNGKVWKQEDYPNSKVTRQTTPASQELVVRGPLLGDGDAKFGEFREVRYRLSPGVDHLELEARYYWGPDVNKTKRAWLMFDLPLALPQLETTYGSPYTAVPYREFSWDHSGLQRIRSMQDWCSVYAPAADTAVDIAGPSGLIEVRPEGLTLALLSRHGSEPAETAIGIDGEHSFQYALRSHKGDWRAGNTVRLGTEHRAGVQPLLAVLGTAREGNFLPPQRSLLSIGGEHVVITALKQAHDGHELLLRLYEAQGKPGTVGLGDASGDNILHASKSNLLEDVLEPLDGEQIKHIELRPWQILSLRMTPVSRGAEVDPNWKRNWKAAPVVEIETTLGPVH